MLSKNKAHSHEDSSPEDLQLIELSNQNEQALKNKNKGKDELEDVLMQQKDDGDMGAVDELMK